MGKRIFAICLMAALFVGFSYVEATAVSSVRGAGTVVYNKNSYTDANGVTTDSSRFVQSYSAGIRHDITDTITIGMDLLWYLTETDTTKDSSYSPVITLKFTPPGLYNFKFGHSRLDSLPSEGQHTTNTITYTSFDLPQSRWPSLKISYNMSENFNHTSPKTLDNRSTSLSLGTAYSFEAMEGEGSVSYRFRNDLTESNISDVTSESIDNSLGTNYSKSFMGDRLKVSLYASISSLTTTYRANRGVSRFSVYLPGAGGLICSACVGSLAVEPELVDNNTTSPLTSNVDLALPDWHIGIDTGANNDVAGLDVYISTSFGEESAIFSTYNFGWQVYGSTDNIGWTAIGGLTTTYNTFYHRFRFEFTESNYRYFKVVNTTGNGSAIDVTEIEAFSYLLKVAKKKDERTTDASSMGVRISYREGRGNINYNLNLSQSSVDVNNREYSSMSHGLNGGYIVIPRYLRLSGEMSMSVSESSGSNFDTIESERLSYRFSANSSILPTLRGSASYNYNEDTYGGEKTRKSTSVAFNATMDIYRGIRARLSLFNRDFENLLTKDRLVEDVISGNLTLKPWKKVGVFVNSSVNRRTYETPTEKISTEIKTLDCDINLRLTKNFYYTLSLDIEPVEETAHSLGWRLTRALNATIYYSESDLKKSNNVTIGWVPLSKVGFSLGYSESEQFLTGTASSNMYVRGHIRFL